VVATDAGGNVRTNNYQTVVPAEPTYSPTYDTDGNELTSGAGQTYTWDAKNELASITYTGGASTLFTYDALNRRIKIVEKNSGGTVTSTKQLVWNGNTLAEGRDASNTVTKKFFAQGEQISGTSYYYTHDHLGCIREMTDSSGTIQARYDYDPYGRTTLVSGTNLSDFQYAGMYAHQTSGLNLTKYRAYDPNTARWLARDPIGEDSGINLYGYVGNNPIDRADKLGLYYAPFAGLEGCPCGYHKQWDQSHFEQVVNAANFNVGFNTAATITVVSFLIPGVGEVVGAYQGGVILDTAATSWDCVKD
jgi:RHS repeat-associated protein